MRLIPERRGTQDIARPSNQTPALTITLGQTVLELHPTNAAPYEDNRNRLWVAIGRWLAERRRDVRRLRVQAENGAGGFGLLPGAPLRHN